MKIIGPILRDSALERRYQDQVRDSVINEGRAAYRAGQRLKDCPPFVDNDMAINWKLGWRYARSDARRAKRK